MPPYKGVAAANPLTAGWKKKILVDKRERRGQSVIGQVGATPSLLFSCFPD